MSHHPYDTAGHLPEAEPGDDAPLVSLVFDAMEESARLDGRTPRHTYLDAVAAVNAIRAAAPGWGHERPPRQRRLGGPDAPEPDGSEDSWPDTYEALAEGAHGLICNVDGVEQGWEQRDEWVGGADRWCARYDRVTAAAPGQSREPELDDRLARVASKLRAGRMTPSQSLVVNEIDRLRALAHGGDQTEEGDD